MSTELLTPAGIRLGLSSVSKRDAIEHCGRLLHEIGAVAEPYVAAMHERESTVSTYVGEGVAIPHGTDASRAHVLRTSLVVLQYPDGIDWGDGADVRMCVGIASNGNEHVGILSTLATILLNGDDAETLRSATEQDTVLRLLATMNDAASGASEKKETA